MKKKILIRGKKVHDVGYRLFLMNLADDLGIENFDAKNIKEDGEPKVKVLVESPEDITEKFFSTAKEDFPKHADVDSVDMEDYDGRVKSLESFRSGFMASQQLKIANAGVAMVNELMAFRKETREGLRDIKADTSQIKADTSQIREDTSQIREDTSQIKADTSHIQDIKANTSKIPGIESNTSEMKETLHYGISEIVTIKREQAVMRKDIIKIKKALHMV